MHTSNRRHPCNNRPLASASRLSSAEKQLQSLADLAELQLGSASLVRTRFTVVVKAVQLKRYLVRGLDHLSRADVSGQLAASAASKDTRGHNADPEGGRRVQGRDPRAQRTTPLKWLRRAQAARPHTATPVDDVPTVIVDLVKPRPSDGTTSARVAGFLAAVALARPPMLRHPTTLNPAPIPNLITGAAESTHTINGPVGCHRMQKPN